MSSQNGSNSNNTSSREFVEGWTLAQTLGEGAYGEVKLLINRQTGEAVAMKMVDLKKHPDAFLFVRKEVCIQKILNDPHILKYFGKRSQGDIEYIFLEYAAGGELFDRIEPDVGMAQHEAQKYFNQLLSGVKYLHSRGIAHRDLKPENILLDEHDNIKISDFGMATMFRMKGKERLLDKRCGTLPYVAPEVLARSYHATPADIWSCGVILVTMLAGELPWDQPTEKCPEYVVWIENEKWTTTTPWKKMDNLAISLLRKILAQTPSSRLSLEKIMEHKWCHMQFSDSGKSHEITNYSESAHPAKRLCSNQDNNCISPYDDTGSGMMYSSQPMPVIRQDNDVIERPKNNRIHGRRVNRGNHNGDEVDNGDDVENINCLGFSFSQPALLDDLILCSQMNPTQSATNSSSQNMFLKLVKRMTRFFLTTKYDESIKRLCQCLDKLGCTWKINSDDSIITATTTDRRKLPLVFKAHVIEMDGKILVDFRLSKGCGLEFKRRFIRIKQMLEDIVLKGPITWPIAIATNSVP